MSKKNIKILLVEDEMSLADMYQMKFKREDFDTTLLADGEQVLNQATALKPDIILLDIILPKVDGFAVLKNLKASPKTKKIPVIMLTNLGQEEDVKKGKELGAADYLVKANLTPSQVVSKIKQVLKLK